jgi:hypothetical protein
MKDLLTPQHAHAVARSSANARMNDLLRLKESTSALTKGKTTTATGVLSIEEECYALAVAGRTPLEIANHVSATRTDLDAPLTAETAQRAVEAASQRRQMALTTSLTHHLALDLERVEKLVSFLWTKAMGGDASAIATITNLLRRKASLLGLDAPEVRLSLHANAAQVNLEALTMDELILYRDLMEKMQNSPAKDVTPVPTVGHRFETMNELPSNKHDPF